MSFRNIRFRVPATLLLLCLVANSCGGGGSVDQATIDASNDSETAPAEESGVSGSLDDFAIDVSTVVPFDSSPKHDAIFEAVFPLHGPTGDAAALAAMIMPFAEFTSPDGTVLLSHGVSESRSDLRIAVPQEIDEAVDFFKTDLAGRGWELTEEMDPDIQRSMWFGRAGRLFDETLQVTVESKDLTWSSTGTGGALMSTGVTLSYQISAGFASGYATEEFEQRADHFRGYVDFRRDRFAGWQNLLPEGGTNTSSSLRTEPGTNWSQFIHLEAYYSYPRQDPAGLFEEIQANLATQGLELAEVNGFEPEVSDDFISVAATFPSNLDPDGRLVITINNRIPDETITEIRIATTGWADLPDTVQAAFTN